MAGFLRNRPLWPLIGLGTLSFWGMGQVMRRMYAPHYPDIALHAGLALVARPRRVLAIAAHPGELELYAGGTLFLMAQAGSTITAAVLTVGEAAAGQQNLDEIRRREQEQAAAALGYGRLVQLRLPDQGLTEHPQLGAAIRQVWEEARPEAVVAPDPRGLFPLGHPDAAAAGYAAVRAPLRERAPGARGTGARLRDVPAALGRAALLVGREKIQEETRVLLYGTRRPNLLVDVTEVLQEKVQGVNCHRSQLRGPARLVPPMIRYLGRLSRRDTPAYYVEGFYRVL